VAAGTGKSNFLELVKMAHSVMHHLGMPQRLSALGRAPLRSRSLTTVVCRVEEYRFAELTDVNYRREDMSVVHAHEARQAFLQEISKGEALINLAEAALLVASEDDALGRCLAIITHPNPRLKAATP
jgi:hypothetical protein